MTDQQNIRVIAGEPEDTLKAKLGVIAHGQLTNGTFAATVTHVAGVQRKKDRAWMLRVIVQLDQGGRYLLAWQNLARDPDDSYALTKGQMPAWRAFLARLQLPTDGTVKEQVHGIAGLLGSHVEASIKLNTFTGKWDVRLSRPADAADGVLAAIPGVEITRDGEIRSTSRPDEAQSAYEQLLGGLGAARVGMSVVAEACFRLSREQRWVDLGFDTLGEFLAQPEISLTRTAFFDLADIWEQYVLEAEIPAERIGAVSDWKLAIPLRAIKAGDVDATDAFGDAEALGARDLREKYRQERGPAGGTDDAPDPEPDTKQSELSDCSATPGPACPHCGLEPHDDQAGLYYANRRWPVWVTPDMARAAMAVAAVEAA